MATPEEREEAVGRSPGVMQTGGPEDRMTFHAPHDHRLRCVIVTPERAVLDEKADFVVLPMIDGELGVLPTHAPLIGRLGKGELRITRGDAVTKWQVVGGFAQVRANVVTVLTGQATRETA
jgi:ATP synthase F1 epsilon subunit